MLRLKKTAMAMVAFGCSSVFAGVMGPVCTSDNVTVPCEHSAWDFGAQALYLQANYSGDSFSGVTFVSAQDGVFHRIIDRWGFGFKVEGSYHFGTGSDLNLNWYHFDRGSERTVGVSAGDVFLQDISSYPGTGGPFEFILYRRTQWDAVNFEFGQHTDFGARKNIRFHGGVQYARINTRGAHIGTLALAFTPNADTTTFNGFGPRLGADMSYDWGPGFHLYANGATALLIGNSIYKDVFDAALIRNGTLHASTTAFVPELEAKLGVKYSCAVARGDLDVDLGWMWTNYFNAHLYSSYSLVPQQTNFAVQGPYLGLKWLGNIG